MKRERGVPLTLAISLTTILIIPSHSVLEMVQMILLLISLIQVYQEVNGKARDAVLDVVSYLSKLIAS